MSTFKKHFGLKSREESLLFKELEKVRQEAKKDLLKFKQKLASNLTSNEGLDHHPRPARPGEKRSGSFTPRRTLSKGSPPAKVPATAAGVFLQEALQGIARPSSPSEAFAVRKTRPFRPQEFYLRSSAFLRYRIQKIPPIITPDVGTSKPVVLRPLPTSLGKSRARLSPRSPLAAAARRGVDLAEEQEANQEITQFSEAQRAKDRKTSSISSEDSDWEAGWWRRRVKIRAHFMSQGSVPRGSEADGSISKAVWESGLLRDVQEVAQPELLPTRVIPRTIEEVITSLQSEAQLASDQIIRELIQSILGQNYDIKMEDISLMGKLGPKTTELEAEAPRAEEETLRTEAESSQMEAEQELQISVEEPQVSMFEEPLQDVSSIFQIEQEAIPEWEGSETGSMLFGAQDMSRIQTAEPSSKPLQGRQPPGKSKVHKQLKSGQLLQIRGKEVKRKPKSKPRIPAWRLTKSLKYRRDKNLPKKILQAPSIPHMHDLCTTIPGRQLPIDLHLASRVYHTVSKKGHRTLVEFFGSCFLDDHFLDTEKDKILYGIPVKRENEDYACVPLVPPGIPSELAQGTMQYVHNLQLSGEETSAYPEITKMFWNPSAPKFSVPECVMRDIVYPKYESVQRSRILTEKILSESKERISLSGYRRMSFKVFLLKKSASFENIKKCLSTQSTQLKRAKSAVELRKEFTTKSLELKDDIQSNLRVLMYQKRRALELQFAEQKKAQAPFIRAHISELLESIPDNSTFEDISLSLIEASKKAGITYIVFPKRRMMKWKKRLKSNKLTTVYKELAKPRKTIQRSLSHGILPGERKCFLRVPLYERQVRCPSLPLKLDFDKFVESRGGIPRNTNPRMWAAEIFIKDKIPKVPPPVVKTSVEKEISEKVEEPPKLELSDFLGCDLPPEVIEHYKSEVKTLTQQINNKILPEVAYCRRGAIYRHLGKLQSAMNDLQEAIILEPMLLNAYWHRHFIYLFQDRINDALDDLNYISKYNKNNTEAYLSKAEIFKNKENTALAILNYTLAIKCRPTEADSYFRRGEMHEKANRVLAIDDYSKCIFYDPQRVDALLKRGMFFYENENWTSAIQDFTAFLNIDPKNLQARIHRARAYFKRSFYKQAIQDFSIAIHLDPNNWLSFYYRACLFRKTNPRKALQDYSISVLLNDGYENFSCFLHRGIVYVNLKLWWLAICDFEAAISLERTVTLAYINIGLIYLLHLENYNEAICWFSEAIKIDPSCIQSYICRAEAYYKLHKLKRAVKELSRAIHFQPDGVQLYIIRGQYLLMMKCYDLAKFTIYQVAEMNRGLIELSPIQQAIIYSFCENHEKAIQVLEESLWSKPEVTMFIIAKTLMKAKKFKEALRMLKKALEICSCSLKGQNAAAFSSECLYNLGLCYIEENNFQMAFDSFTKAVKANPDFAEAFYQRGFCKVKLHKESSVLDFNRAITINPKHYQAYLGRVAYYGLKGRFSKAILNCNEAISIYPESVRAYVCRGALKYYSGNYRLAIEDLTTAINMDKKCYVAFYNRALCYIKTNELRMALADYGIVLLLEAVESIILNTLINRGIVYAEQEQYGFALEDFKQAAQISQTNVSLCHATAMCHYRIKEYEDAVSFFTWALKLNPHFLDALVGRGNSYMEYGHDEATKQAQKDFLKALHFNPSCIKARISLCYNLQAQGKFQKAWNHFTIAIEVDPKSYLAYEGRAVVCLQMGNNFAAMQDINVAIKINTTAEFITNRGVIHEFMGQKQNAIKDYQAAIALDPKYSLAYFNAGNIYFHHRQFSQANDYFSKALKFDPEDDHALMNRAITNTILNKYEEAEEDFACAVERCPFWAAVYFNRAHLYCCLEKYELAEEELSKALSLKPNDTLAYHLRAKVRGKIGLIEQAMADYNQALDLEDCALHT
ncbi:tetratricopeptide repeat protein 6 [Marmota marmota marmota]|uniref:tetratricopeptide repeat protein 6 n=1 Tax=Marmota marmota marmota TaxID=9994 RepID=UPI0020927C8B|nr:tetratricopeptide repeat protein 6 [Marmota marmota marmota]